MPILWLQSIVGALLTLAGTLVGKILISLGISGVSYIGISALLGKLETLIFGQLGGIGGPAGQILGMLHLGDAAGMIVSAITVKWTLAGLSSSGSLFKWANKKPDRPWWYGA